MSMAKLTSAALVACLFLACASVRAGDLKGACDEHGMTGAYWSHRNDATASGTYSDLSECQKSTMKMSSTNTIILGGKGSANIIGIPAGGDSGGCTDPGHQCMSWCQALCCIAKGCKMAHIYAKEETKDYVVYKEKVTTYYCYLWATGSYKGSSNQITCTKGGAQPGANCPALMQQNFKVNSTTYDYLIYNNANSVCQMPPATGRRLASTDFKINTPIPDAAELNKMLSNFKIDKEMLKQKVKGAGGKTKVCAAVKNLLKQKC
jgi:hypothetical protein